MVLVRPLVSSIVQPIVRALADSVDEFSMLDNNPTFLFDMSDTSASNIQEVANAVSGVTNKGSDPRNMAQTTEANKPTTNTANINGHNALVFDGVSDYLTTTTGATDGTVTWYVVAQFDDAAPVSQMIVGGTNAFYQDLGVDASNKWYVDTFFPKSGTTAVDNSPHVISVVWTGGANAKLYIDGVLEISDNFGVLGRQGIRLGCRDNLTQFFKGKLGLFAEYDGNHSDDLRVQHENFLKARYGVS